MFFVPRLYGVRQTEGLFVTVPQQIPVTDCLTQRQGAADPENILSLRLERRQGARGGDAGRDAGRPRVTPYRDEKDFECRAGCGGRKIRTGGGSPSICILRLARNESADETVTLRRIPRGILTLGRREGRRQAPAVNLPGAFP
jgi:hypothetical protein